MPKKPTDEKASPKIGASLDYRNSDDFRSVYANHSVLEYSAWDLKLIFGETDQTISVNTIVQHTAVRLSWPQIKILSYFLQIHLAAYESDQGRLKVPAGVIPGIIPPDTETAKKFPNARKVYEAWTKLHDDFLAANPEAVSVTDNKAKSDEG
jgi:hypothetical protein